MPRKDQPKSNKKHISFSAMDTYLRCPRQYEYRYIEGLIIPPGIALLQGTGVHHAAEHNFRQKIETHADLPRAEIIDAAVQGFKTELQAGYQFSPDESSRGAKTVLAEATDQLADMAAVHADEQAPDYQPVAVEKFSRIELPNASMDLVAYTDLIDNRGRVTDFKTAGKSKTQTDVVKSQQLTIYAACYRLETGAFPAEVRLDVVVKTKKPKRQLLSATRTQADIEILARRVNAVVAAIDAGIFPPCDTGAWCCSKKFCGYWHLCPYFVPGSEEE